MTDARGRSFEFGAPGSDSGVRSESSAKSTMTGRVGASWDLGFGTALIEIGADSGLRPIRSLADNHFCERTSPLSNYRSSIQKSCHGLSKTYVSPHFRTER